MNHFDTLKLKVTPFSTQLKPEFNKHLIGCASKNPIYGPSFILNRALYKSGINGISVKENRDVVVVVSAKVLGDRYPELISADTFPAVMEGLSEYLEFDNNRFVADAEVWLCHVTQNVPITAPVWNYLQALSCISHPAYKRYAQPLREVNFGKIETIAFQKIHRSDTAKEYISFYDKYKEMSSKGKKDKFYKSLGNFDLILKQFKNCLRVELQLRTFSSIRSAFDLSADTTIRLSELLNSQVKPLLNKFNHIREYSTNLDIQRHPIGVSLRQVEMDAVIHQNNYDMNAIKQLIKNTATATSNVRVRQYQRRTEELLRQKMGLDGDKQMTLLDEIAVGLSEG